MKYIALLVSVLAISTLTLKSQDIIVSKDGNRIYTKVIKIGKDTITCKDVNRIDTAEIIFLTKDINKILLEIGIVYDFEKAEELNPPAFHLAVEKKTLNKTSISVKTHDLGIGTTGAILNSSNSDIPFQLNYRLLVDSKSNPNRHTGFNVNYSSQILSIPDCKRVALHYIYQEDVYKNKNMKVYANVLVGLGYYQYKEKYTYYDYVDGKQVPVERENSGVYMLPSMHLGFGAKFKIDENKGFFLEGGIGGTYLLNTGLYFK